MPRVMYDPLFVRRTTAQWIIMWILRLIPKQLKPQIYEFAKSWSERNGLNVYPRIYRLPFNLVLKTSVWGSSNEGAAMRFVESLGVNSSRFIDHASGGPKAMYLVSTWVDGDCCMSVWDQLTAEDRSMIVSQLRVQINLMREKTISSNHAICNTEGNFVDDPRIPWVARETPKVFTSSQEFFKHVWIDLKLPPLYGEPFGPIYQQLIDRTDRPIVFCHGDLLPKNIILPGGLDEWRKGRSTVCLIDWQNAGWLPLQWEAIKSSWTLRDPESPWFFMMKELFPESNAELDADMDWTMRTEVIIY